MKSLLLFFFASVFACNSAQPTVALRTAEATPKNKDKEPAENYANSLKGSRWKSEQGHSFLNPDQATLAYKTPGGKDIWDHFGFFLTFEENTFISSYSAQCGNDCFTTVYGGYRFTAADRIEVRVDSSTARGFCEKQGTTPINKTYQYRVEQDKETLKLHLVR